MQNRWDFSSEATLTQENLAALFDNRIPAIRIPGFASSQEVGAFAAAVNSVEPKWYKVGRPAAYLGITLIQYVLKHTSEDYFAAVADANSEIARVTASSFNYVDRLISKLADISGNDVSVAHEPASGEYFAGIIRMISHGSDIHFDFAPSFAEGLLVGKVNAQLAWNVYIDEPEEGGETRIYNQPWERPEGDKGSYRLYTSDELADAQSYTFRPVRGDLVIFNSRNPHAVLPSGTSGKAKRMAGGSFIGRLPDGKIILWS